MNDAASTSRVPILNTETIARKLQRMAWQILEHNSNRQAITLIGVADNGEHLAQKLADHLQSICALQITVLRLDMNKRDPLKSPISISGEIRDTSLVLIDDVANSGKTLLYALNPLIQASPEKILITVLVDRMHKSFPVTPDIVGQRIATTLQEHILVTIEGESIAAYLE